VVISDFTVNALHAVPRCRQCHCWRVVEFWSIALVPSQCKRTKRSLRGLLKHFINVCSLLIRWWWWWSQLASCLIYAQALLEYIILFCFYVVWVHSFSKMLPSMKFAEDKVLVFVILREKCKNSTSLSLTLILTLISRADWSNKSEWYCRTVHCCQINRFNKERTQTSTEMGSDQSAVRLLLCHNLTADWSMPISVLVATGSTCARTAPCINYATN